VAWFRKIRKNLEAREWIPFVGFAAVLILAVVAASVFTALRAKLGSAATDLGTLWLLAIAAVVATWYALETFLLRKEAEKNVKAATEANTFSALTAIHQTLMKDNSRMLRRVLMEKGENELAEALAKTVGSTFVGGAAPRRTVLLDRILDTLQKNDQMAGEFFSDLQEREAFFRITFLAVFESVLADFDLIAVPHNLGIQAAGVAAEAYRPILEHTSRPLLIFIAIRRRLAGESNYRKHYVRLLRELGIPTLAVVNT